MNLTLRDATAFMAHLSPVAPTLALSSRQRRDDAEGKALVSDASEFTRLRVGSPPKRTVRSSVCTTGLRLPHRPGGAFGRTDWQLRRERGQGCARVARGWWRSFGVANWGKTRELCLDQEWQILRRDNLARRRGWTGRFPKNALSSYGDRWFESPSLKRRVRCEPHQARLGAPTCGRIENKGCDKQVIGMPG